MMSKPSYARPDGGPDEGIAENQCRHCKRFYPDSLADQDGLCVSCIRMTGTLNPRPGDLPQCRECGRPSPNGDPCDDCAEVAHILSMTDEEVIASSSPEDVAWSEGVVAGIKIGKMLGEMRAARERRAAPSRLGKAMGEQITTIRRGLLQQSTRGELEAARRAFERFLENLGEALSPSDTDRSGEAGQTAKQAGPKARAGAEGIAQPLAQPPPSNEPEHD